MKKTKPIALGGIMSAMCVVIMLVGAIIGVGVYVAPMIAGLCLIPTGRKYGVRYHALLWITVSVLSVLIVPDIEESLMFFVLFGFYPIAYPYFMKLPRIVRFIAKLVYFNAVILVIEYLIITFFVPETLSFPMAIFLLGIGNFTFILYDKIMPKADRLLEKNIGRLVKKF